MRLPTDTRARAGTPQRLASERVLITLNTAAGVAALGGAWYALSGAPNVPTAWLKRSPFSTYAVPGLVLGGVYAPASLAAAATLWRRHPRAADVALAGGAVQVGWIAAQVAVIGPRSVLQPLMLGVGLVDLGLARLARRSADAPAGQTPRRVRRSKPARQRACPR